jgi:dTDP-4-dehydrorhamnose reductase
MRILILGADGMFGHVAFATLSRVHEVHGTCRRALAVSSLAALAPSGRCIDRVDAGDSEGLRHLVQRLRPQVVVNAIGLVKQRAGAGDLVRQIALNALFPHQVAALADAVGAKLIQLGTDCVFSGKRGGYTLADAPDPTDTYGRCKYLGEVTHAPHLTLRTSFVGRQLAGAYGLVEWFLAQPSPVPGFVHAVFSGLTTAALADVLDRILRTCPDLTGVHHVAAAPISKHDLLCRLRDALAPGVEIVPDARVRCDRSLDGAAFRRDTGIAIAGWDAMIEHLAAEAPRYDRWRALA